MPRKILPMREITTHKVNGCNEAITIEAGDKLTVGGAPACYHVTVREYLVGPSPEKTFDLPFQDGPIGEVGTNGLTHEALLAVLIDRLECFQAGPYTCNENMHALVKLVEALQWLQSRTKARVKRGVEGTHAV